MTKASYLIQAGKFKAQCLKLMDEVNEQHISFVITKHGKPIAKLIPMNDEPIDSFGCLKHTVNIQGDIIEPIHVEWEANE